MSLMNLTVPPGAFPGSMVTFQTEDGAMFQAQVPQGVAPGQTFQAQIPDEAPPAPMVQSGKMTKSKKDKKKKGACC
eukprot:NODE_25174_length_596_cov_5.166311.p2 GENE.NODE_25174_length_596_cov_5.166311~~NODE_25174_length_596_cov_5.166311.p2  ORF type:complete len:76 (+),score=18.68 NODE_25174_length_596_cov_5.166311:96-323(+)